MLPNPTRAPLSLATRDLRSDGRQGLVDDGRAFEGLGFGQRQRRVVPDAWRVTPHDDAALGSDQGLAAQLSSVEMTPETGKPEPMPLPIVMMSGSTLSCMQPNILPVRPKPVIISSEI